MAREVKATVFFTVEHSLEGNKGTIAFMFPGDEYGRNASRELFTQLSRQHQVSVILGGQSEEISHSWVNLIAWDRHPTQDEAKGLIIAAASMGRDT